MSYYCEPHGRSCDQPGRDVQVQTGTSVIGEGVSPFSSVVTGGLRLLLLPSQSHPGCPDGVLHFEDSDGDSKGSQEPDKQLTSPEVMARSNSSD